ncbi:WD repeat-containing and planar cell polarity effector protein fritz-like protein [Acropora cervicornis]|uniref:WD repeat-containing and planar cell polarity effector protein fritz-like protein n=1 Tax=Acropora cervicornis TaxID=6130 RepID=A0AAD9QFR6_ACRCE|nr:WD repeat-containing and planar cell polarity effector protein fritz-like protein [Acropora cervicornis]
MASLLSHLHVWSLKKYTSRTGSDIGTHVYHEKASGSSIEEPYTEQRRLWGEDRGVSWTPKNRRPEKLRDSIKDLEDMVQNCKVLDIRWKTLRNVQLLLNNGVLVSVLVSFNSGDIERIWIDKSLTGKIPDLVSQDSFLLFSMMDKAKLCYIYFSKKTNLDFKKLEKMSALEPKVVVWWCGHHEEAPKIEMLCFSRTECDPIHVSFSYNQPHHVVTLEQSSAVGGDFSVDSCIYEYNAAIVVHQRNHAEDKLLLGCEDGTLMLYDDHRHSISHPLASRNPVRLGNVAWSSDAPIGNFTDNSIGCYDNLFILFDRGPLCLLRFELGVLTHGRLGTVEMVSEYIRHCQPEEAVNFLNSMNWNTEGKACFAGLALIMNYLLKLPLNSEREGLLEDTLGSFYAPSRPLSDVTVLEYKRFEKAFLLAVDIGAKDLFMDIHYLAYDCDTGESYEDEEDDLSYIDDQTGNDKRSQEIHQYHDDLYGYMNDRLDSQHIVMPVGEEEDDTTFQPSPLGKEKCDGWVLNWSVWICRTCDNKTKMANHPYNAEVEKLRCANSVKHFQIGWDGSQYSFGMGTFSCLNEFVEHFENKPLIGGDSGVLTLLKYPYPRDIAEPATYEKVRVHAEWGKNRKSSIANSIEDSVQSFGSKEGYLTKLGGKVKQNWKTRWFVLLKNELKYFKAKGVSNLCHFKLRDKK